jgi:putative transposase
MRFRRKNIRLPEINYRGRAWFFVTLCCESRHPVFANGEWAVWLIGCLNDTAEKYHFGVHAFCVMPEHLHVLAEGLTPESNLLLFVGNFKLLTSREYRKQTSGQLWQKKFFDHILRPKDSPEAVAWYIGMNPARKGLCKSFEEYPFSGSFTRPWKISTDIETWVPPWKETRDASLKAGATGTP